MRIIKLFLLGIILPFCSRGQNVEATYLVTQNIIVNLPDVGAKKIATLESTGHLYRNSARYIYFERPNYLAAYPEGIVTYELPNGGNYKAGISMDSIQRLSYKNMDSLVRIYRAHSSGKGQTDFSFKQKFEADYFEWKMINETKIIDGLSCQKAELSIKNKLQWVVWFTPDIPMQAGISNIIGIPGLIVNAEHIPINVNYKLVKYKVGQYIAEEIFHPKEFEEPFVMSPDLKKNSSPLPKSKVQKQAELLNQE